MKDELLLEKENKFLKERLDKIVECLKTIESCETHKFKYPSKYTCPCPQLMRFAIAGRNEPLAEEPEDKPVQGKLF